MMSRRCAAGVAGLGGAVALMAAAGSAWACTPQARVVAASAESGPGRSAVVVRGEAVAPAGPVELRWDSVQGPAIGGAVADANGAFSADAHIPDAAPGVHTILVVAQGNGVGRLAFEVTPASVSPAPAGSPSLWAGPAASTSTASSGLGGTAVGAGLLGAGAVALSAGAAVAALNRRRVLASALAGRSGE